MDDYKIFLAVMEKYNKELDNDIKNFNELITGDGI